MYFIRKKVFHRALSCQPLYSMLKSIMLWRKLTLVLNVLSMSMIFVIMYKSRTIDAIQRKLQHTINRLEKCTLENGFTISKNKTVAMHFCPDIIMHGSCFEIRQWPYPVCKRSQMSWFDLGYETHFWTSYQISQSTVSKIPEHPESPLSYRMGCRSNYIIEIISLPCEIKIGLWLYSCIVYGSASKTALATLDPVHNQGLCLRNSQRKVSSTVHHQIESQSRKSSLLCCVQSQIPGSV